MAVSLCNNDGKLISDLAQKLNLTSEQLLKNPSLGFTPAATEQQIQALWAQCNDSLDLTNNNKVNDQVLYYIKNQASKLSVLNLAGCVLLTKQGLFSFFSACNQLKKLSLAACNITDTDAPVISKALEALSQLTVLDLTGNPLTDKGCKILMPGLFRIATLSTLLLNSSISAETKLWLKAKLPRISFEEVLEKKEEQIVPAEPSEADKTFQEASKLFDSKKKER